MSAASTYCPPMIELIIFQTGVFNSASDWIISPPFPSFCDKAPFLTSPLSLPPPLISCLFIRPLIHSSPAICSVLPHTPNSSFCIHALALRPRHLFPPFFLSLSLFLCPTSWRVSVFLHLAVLLIVDFTAPHAGTLFLLRRPSICPHRWMRHVFVSLPDGHLLCSPFPQQPFYWLLRRLESSGRQLGNKLLEKKRGNWKGITQ